MVGSLGEKFSSASMSYPPYEHFEPNVATSTMEANVTVCVNPQLIEQTHGASLLPMQPNIMSASTEVGLGELLGGVGRIVEETAHVGGQLMQAELAKTGQISTEPQSVMDSSLSAQATQYTKAAAELQQNSQMPAPSMT